MANSFRFVALSCFESFIPKFSISFAFFTATAATTARRRSPQKVVDEIKNVVQNFGVKEISFWDDTMSYHKKWMNQFYNGLEMSIS